MPLCTHIITCRVLRAINCFLIGPDRLWDVMVLLLVCSRFSMPQEIKYLESNKPNFLESGQRLKSKFYHMRLTTAEVYAIFTQSAAGSA